MNSIKELREQHGYTQADLVAQSGLSLRTVQRVEANEKEPTGHSLKMLAKAFGLTPVELRQTFTQESNSEVLDAYCARKINLSVLAFFGIPFGNIIFPLILWRKNRDSKFVNEIGRRIVNFQIFWTVLMASSLVLAPFINRKILIAHPLIIYILVVSIAINLAVVFRTARSIQRAEVDFPWSPVTFL